MKMSKLSTQRIKDFDKASQSWGWESDQGNGSRVDESNKEYDATKDALVKRIEYLERTIYKYKYGHSPKK